MEGSDRYLLKPAEVALRLGVSRSWLYDAAKEGRIPCIRLGGDDGPVRFLEADLVAWLACTRQDWLPGERVCKTAPRASESRSEGTRSRRVTRQAVASVAQLSWSLNDRAARE